MAARVLIGSFLLMSRAALLKFIGMLSTLVLARVLAPEDFGLVAMAMLVTGFVTVFSTTGSTQYILRADSVDDELLNSAWTLNVILKTGIALLVAAGAPLAANYFEEAQVTPLLLALAVMMAVGPWSNPGLILYQREQNFQPGVRLSIYAKLFSATVAVVAAIILRSYWALILGQMANMLFSLVGSYRIHPHRPRLTTSGIRRQLGFSGWLIPQALLGFARTQIDTFLVSTTFGIGQLGSFHTMKYLAYIPSAHILSPATFPLLTELSKSRNNPAYFQTQHNVCFIVVMALALPMTFVMADTAEPLIRVFLGKQWVEYSDLFRWFAILLPAYALFMHATRMCMVFGKTRMTATYEVFAVAFIFGPILLVGIQDIVAFTALRIILEIIASFLFFTVTTLLYTNLANYLRLLIISSPVLLACCIAMLAAQSLPTTLNAILYLIAYCSLFGLVFGAVLLLFMLTLLRRQREWIYLEAKVTGGLVQLRSKLMGPPQST